MYNVFCILDTYLIKFLIVVYFKKIYKIALHYLQNFISKWFN
jgi:hypothetical protein